MGSGRLRLALTAVLLALPAAAVGCGSDKAATTREVAERYVDAVKAQDWEAACEVSVQAGMDDCPAFLQEVFDDPGTSTPTLHETEATVEEVDGRNLVHFEYTVIR